MIVPDYDNPNALRDWNRIYKPQDRSEESPLWTVLIFGLAAVAGVTIVRKVFRRSPALSGTARRSPALSGNSSREIASELRDHGCAIDRQKGSHQIWKCPPAETVVLPVHRGRDVSPGVARSIRKQIGSRA